VKKLIIVTVVCIALAIAAFAAQQTQPAPAGPNTSATPGTTTQFPLAAAAGSDSGALTRAPAGAVNQGPFDPATW
jgi:hypothetical protein